MSIGRLQNEAPLCECGCGERTAMIVMNNTALGRVKGEFNRFVQGHQRRKAPEEILENAETGCWEWQRYRFSNGYGTKRVDGKGHLAHRWYYEQYVGPIPEGLVIDHLCRNRACVNPGHLEPVTHSENLRRGERANSKLTPELARQVRKLAEKGELTQKEIGAWFGLGQSQVSAIRLRKAWGDA